MLKIIHTADFHIGVQFSSFDENLRVEAENLQFSAIMSMVNYANTNDIDAILIAGDTFDNHEVSFEKRIRLFSILENFSGKIFIVCGNHDYYFKSSIWEHSTLPDNIFLFKSNQWQAINFEKFTIYGASFTNIYEKIDIDCLEIPSDEISIGLVHADILTDSQYNPITKSDLKNSNFNYVAVGHNHKYSDISKSTDTFFAASGNISATGFDEFSKKGFIVATIDEFGSNFEFVESRGLEILDLTIDVSLYYDFWDIRNEVLKISLKNIFLNLTLIGIDNCEIDEELLKARISNFFFSVSIQNLTDKPTNLWRFIDDDSLLGEFTRLMRVKYDSQNDTQEVLNALKLGLDALIF